MDAVGFPHRAEDVSSLLPSCDRTSKSRAIEKTAPFFHLAPGSVEGGGG